MTSPLVESLYSLSVSGCPFVYIWNGNRFVEDNNILPESEYSDSTKGDVIDFYKLRRKLAICDNEYVLQVREFEQERSRFDQFRLLVVDHPSGTNIAVDRSGEIILFGTPMRMTQATLRGNSVLDKLSMNDSVMVPADAGDLLS